MQKDLEKGNNELKTVTRTAPDDVSVSAQAMEDEIPDKFSGWGLSSVLACALMNANTWGANSGYALYYQEYLNNNIFPGTNKVEFGMVGGLCFGSGLIFSPVINYFVGVFGLKQTIVLGALIQFAGVFMASFSTHFWELALTQGVLQGVGMAFIATTSVNVVPQWFKGGRGGKRNLASGIGAAGSGVGGIIYNAAMQPIMAKHGWQWAVRTQAIMCCTLHMVAVCMIRSRNKHIKPVYKVYDRAVSSNFGSWVMMVWMLFTMFGYVVLMYNLGDFTRSMGYSSSEASIVSTMVAVGIVYGRPTVGFIMDVAGPVQTTAVASSAVALFCFAMWLPCKNYGTAIALGLIEGALMGTIWVSMATIAAEVVGLRKFGIEMSMSWISCGVCGFVSPIIGIALKSGGPPNRSQYRAPTIFVGCAYLCAAICMVILRGWIIVRTRLTKEGATEQDKLDIRVPVLDAAKSVFDLRWYRI